MESTCIGVGAVFVNSCSFFFAFYEFSFVNAAICPCLFAEAIGKILKELTFICIV